MLSACQWAWVTGSMDEVRGPFLYHKAATYQFAREQLQSPETAQSGDTMLAISALALTEVGRIISCEDPMAETDNYPGRSGRAGRIIEAFERNSVSD